MDNGDSGYWSVLDSSTNHVEISVSGLNILSLSLIDVDSCMVNSLF